MRGANDGVYDQIEIKIGDAGLDLISRLIRGCLRRDAFEVLPEALALHGVLALRFDVSQRLTRRRRSSEKRTSRRKHRRRHP